jgi:CubicO group peptidase (beta-lactamase class C family)
VRRINLAAALLLAAPLLGATAAAADLPAAAPDQEGFHHLDQITRFFTNETGSRHIPGAVVMIARDGKVVYDEAFGTRDPASGAPMRKDTIFRIYSMTKPVTGVAVMMLVEQGRIRLSDPVSDYLPALKHPGVMTETTDAQGRRVVSTVPASREITIEDLLRHTSGITYGIGHSPAEQALRQAGLGLQLGRGDGNPLSRRLTDQQLVDQLGQVPLMVQPGSAWVYGRSIDVLLALVEVVSGQRGDAFMQDRIFGPLGMGDTCFNVPPDKRDRVAEPGPDPITGQTPDLTDITQPRSFLGGGEGLLSTAADYMRFALMLENHGEANGVRLLSPESVTTITSDHLPPGLARSPSFGPGAAYGFGLTVAVRTQPGSDTNVGEFEWGGAAGTLFWVDPHDHLATVFMVQAPRIGVQEQSVLRHLVYESLR